MVTTLKKIGDEHVLVVDPALMEQLGITAETPLRLSLHGRRLLVEPSEAGEMSDEAFDAALNEVMRTHEGLLRRLA